MVVEVFKATIVRIHLLLILSAYTLLKPSLQPSDNCCPGSYLFIRFSRLPPLPRSLWTLLIFLFSVGRHPPVLFFFRLSSVFRSIATQLNIACYLLSSHQTRCAVTKVFVPWHEMVRNSVVSDCRIFVLAEPYSRRLYNYTSCPRLTVS